MAFSRGPARWWTACNSPYGRRMQQALPTRWLAAVTLQSLAWMAAAIERRGRRSNEAAYAHRGEPEESENGSRQYRHLHDEREKS